MSPSTHSADLSQLQTDTAAILVDTSTTIPGTIATVDGIVDSILVDTGTTIPATIATVDGNVDSILVDTGTTIPATIATVDGNVDSILVDTGTTIPATIATVDGNVDSILVDTGTTIPGRLNTVDTNVATVDTVVDAILVDTTGLDTFLDNARYLVGSKSQPTSISTTSASWVTSGTTVTMPTNAGATYTVICMITGVWQAALANFGYFQLYGSALSNQSYGNNMITAVAAQRIDKAPFGRGGFGSGEVVTLQMKTDGGNALSIIGEVAFLVYQETAT